MRKIEDLPEYQDAKAMEQRLANLPTYAAAVILKNIANQLAWNTTINLEQFEKELTDQEELEGRNIYSAADHPPKDMFGADIQTGDKWFEDHKGRVILNENVSQYLQEVGNVRCYRNLG